jgi:hypothetical protein
MKEFTMQRNWIRYLPLITLLATAQAHALFTRCEMNYETRSGALVFEVGGGQGRVTCWDAIGDRYVTPVSLVVGGAGVKAGYCITSGRISALGVGFTLSEFLSGLGQIELGSMMIAGRTVGAGVRINLAANISGTVSDLRYRGPCFGIGSLQGLITTNVGETVRYPRRDREYLELQRERDYYRTPRPDAMR